MERRDFPGGPVAKTLHCPCWGPGFDLWSETRSPMPQLKDPASAAKTWSTQIDEYVNKYIFKNANIWRGRERATQNCKISLEENTHR